MSQMNTITPLNVIQPIQQRSQMSQLSQLSQHPQQSSLNCYQSMQQNPMQMQSYSSHQQHHSSVKQSQNFQWDVPMKMHSYRMTVNPQIQHSQHSQSFTQMNQMNPSTQINQMNQLNQINQMDEITQTNSLQQSSTMNQLNQLNQTNSINQMNQMNPLTQMNQQSSFHPISQNFNSINSMNSQTGMEGIVSSSSNYQSSYPNLPVDYCELNETEEDTSDDDASQYILNSSFSFLSNSYDSKQDEKIETSDKLQRKYKEFMAWIKKLDRQNLTQKLFVCGQKATETTEKWIHESAKRCKIVELYQVNTSEFLNSMKTFDVVIVTVNSITVLCEKIDLFRNYQMNNIIVCCSDCKNCPKNKGAVFNAVFKRISLK